MPTFLGAMPPVCLVCAFCSVCAFMNAVLPRSGAYNAKGEMEKGESEEGNRRLGEKKGKIDIAVLGRVRLYPAL